MKNTREHILEVSFKLFLQKNFKEVTMKDIVEETGLSKGAFYHYFESKEALFLETLNYIFDVFRIPYDTFSKSVLREFYTAYLEYMTLQYSQFYKRMVGSETAEMNYLVVMFDAVRMTPTVRELMQKSFRDEFSAWVTVVAAARKSGEIKSVMTDDQIAKLFINTNDGIGAKLLLEGKMKKFSAELKELWDGLYGELKM